MCPGPDEGQGFGRIIFEVNQQPVGADMAFPEPLVSPFEDMVTVPWLERLPKQQLPHDGFDFEFRQAAFQGPFVVLLE